MGALGLSLLFSVACFWVPVRGDYFFVVAPNMIRFEHPETVMVSVFGFQKTVSVWFSHGDQKFSEYNNLIVREETPRRIEMVVKEIDLALEDENKPRTIVLNAECDGHHKRKEILLQYSSGYIFVQTSQPIYVPRSTVQIRYLALDESMKRIGNKANVSMDIISPKSQVFSRTHKTKPKEAFYTYDFELPPNPEMGIWTIKVYFRGMYETEAKAFFEIRDYVVPTFAVDIDIRPQTILDNTRERITVTVTSKYVYGKPVVGTADIKLYLAESGEQTELLAMPRKPLNADGVAEFEVDVKSLKRSLELKNKWFPESQRLKVLATTTEGATLKKESGIHNGVIFSRVPYKFNFSRSKKYFRHLSNYYLQVDVTFPNNQIAARVFVKAEQRIAGKTEVNELQGESDDNGRITFIFECSGDTMSFWVTDAKGMSRSEEFVVEAYSGHGEYQILAEHVIKNGKHQLRSNNNMHMDTATGLTSVIIARGKILEAHWEGQKMQVERFLEDGLQEQISPSGRYIIFYCDKETNEVVADSIKFELTPRCKGKEIRLTSEQMVLPGSSKEILVTGLPLTDIGLLAMDKALLLLNSTNILHKHKMFQELESHDLGCGYGGGRNSAHVFNNAGLTVLTNAHMAESSVRQSVTCEQPARKRRSTECEADQRCCEAGEEYAISLYEDAKSANRPKIEYTHCYSEVRKLAIEYPDLLMKCLEAYFKSCFEYVQFRKKDDAPGTKSGDSDYLMDLREIKFDEKAVHVRRDFKESFEFKQYQLEVNSGEAKVKVKYPDSITEWMIQAIGITPTNGVCISEPLNVTVFRDFFIQLDLPYQAVRMEHIDIKATVFYYGNGGDNSSVSVYMDGQKDLCSNTRPGQKSKVVKFEMSPNSAHEVRFSVIPLVAPRKYLIKITAIMNILGVGQVDAIQKDLYVINEGEEKRIQFSSCLDPMELLEDCQGDARMRVFYSRGENPTQIITMNLTLPEHIQGTGQGAAYIYSNNAMEDIVQAVLIGGVEDLLRLPWGCVEQTAITFSPNVYALKYLKITNQVTEEIEMKGNRNIKNGVLREYSFIKQPGNYYPPHGGGEASTWLTAFVAKVFCQANKVVDSVEEAIHITPTVNWLTSHQNADGSFIENNAVVHSEMVGLSAFGRPTLTAFVLITLQECQSRNTKVETAVQKAMKFLESQDINALTGNPKVLPVITYALVLSNSAMKMEFYEKMKSVARRSAGMMYWGWTGRGSVEPSQIEATSYALLAMLQLDDLRASNETVNWISLQRSSFGLFKTTQDTIIGLQALSEYNIRTYRADVDLTVKFMADNYPEKVFKLNKDNALVQKIAGNLPVEVGNDMRVEVTGKGTGKIRVDLRYNVDKTETETCPFEIEVTSKPILKDKTSINIGKQKGCDCGVCDEEDEEAGAVAVDMVFGIDEDIGIDSNFGRKKRSLDKPKRFCVTMEVTSLIDTVGMVTIEVGLETGMTVLKEDLESLEKDEIISMYELPTLGKGFFVLYNEPMSAADKKKYVFTLEDVAGDDLYNRQPASIKVVDYYNPGSRCQSFYGTGSKVESSFSAECKDDACLCLISTCPEDWKEKLKRKSKPAIFLIQRTCDRHYAEYAVKVKIESFGDGDVGRKESMAVVEVLAVYNQGRERLSPGSTIKVYWRMDCEWPKFKKQTKYYIIARDGKSFIEGGQKRFKYYIGEGDIVLQWKPKHTPVGKFMKGYENFWKTRECPK